MEYLDQMATKLLAQAVRQLGMALNESLCVEPDPAIVRALVADARDSLAEFDAAYRRNGAAER